MLKKLLSLTAVLLLANLIPIVCVHGQENKEQKGSEYKTKQKLSKLGRDAPVLLKLDDGSKVSGRIESIGENSFVLAVPVKGDRTARLTNPVVISYSQIRQVKFVGSTGGANLGPGFLAAGALILVLVLVR
jgi:hypothetical protein